MAAHVAFPLPRKLFTGRDAAAAQARNEMLRWTVHPDCVALWGHSKASGRRDTFIGMIDTDTWKIYAAPCFGVTAEQAILHLSSFVATSKAGERAEKLRSAYPKKMRDQTPITDSMFVADISLMNGIKTRLDDHAVPDDLVLVSGSTSAEKDSAQTCTWSTVKGIYGAHGACLVLFEEATAGFDGKSHQALKRWVERHIPGPKPAPTWYDRALGFAIQRDALGYYVRFSSTLNLKQGMGVDDSFAPRADPRHQVGRESRDMPKEWAQRLVLALANDLHVGYFSQERRQHSDPKDKTKDGKFFGRMVSRGEHETTKFKRIYEPNLSDAGRMILSRLT